MTQAQARTDEDNDQVRITTWTFAGSGAATGEHRHDLDYVVVPVTGGTFAVINADGTQLPMNQVAGSAYFRVAGATHDVVSTSEREAVFVEIELKG
jgi:beta-alanine degradation protein BauB